MSRSVDDRIVSMEFDNSKFESNVRTSIDTIDRLKKSLAFENVGKGFDSIEKAAANVSFENIENGVTAIQNRFSALGIVGKRVIENLTDTAMRYVQKTLGFVTNGIVQGGITRATNLENAKFQLQGLLKEDEKVQAVMQDVNNAVDGTAYSLDAAAKVASQLAASGMTAGDEMFKTLRGIAGVAAMTNSSYEDIGNVFTKVAGQGRVMADDLNRLAARGMNAAATLADTLGVTEAEVREMVSDSKIDFKTFAMAMDDAFGEHAKKANQTVLGSISNIKSALGRIGALFISPIIVQNGELVKTLNVIRERINDIKKNIEPIAENITAKINKALSIIAGKISSMDIASRLNNTTKRIQILENVISSLSNVLKFFKSIASSAFGALSDSKLIPNIDGVVSFSEGLRKLSSRLLLTKQESEQLRTAFKGVFDFAKLIGDAIVHLAKGFGQCVSKLTGVTNGVFGLAEAFGKGLSGMTESLRNGGFLKTVDGIGTGIGRFITSIKDGLSEMGAFQAIENLTSDLFNNTGKVLSGAIKMIGSGLKALVTAVGDILTNGDLKFALDGSIFAVILYNIKKVLIQIRKFIEKANPIEGLGKTLQQLKDTLYEYERNLSAGYFLKLGAAILMLAVALKMLSGIDPGKLAASLGAVLILIQALAKSMKSFNKMVLTRSLKSGAKALIPFTAAVLLLSIALKKISTVDWNGLAKGLVGTIALMYAMVGAVKLLGKNSDQFKVPVKTSIALLAIAASASILASALAKFGTMSWPEIGRGLTAMGGALLELTGVILLLGNFGGAGALAGSVGILITSLALGNIADALQELGKMSWSEIGRGLVAMGGALGQIGIVLAALGAVSGFGSILAGGAILLVSKALLDISSVLQELGKMSWSEIGRGLTAMGGALAEIGVVLGILGSFVGFGSVLAGGAIYIVSQALNDISDVLIKFGDMTWDQIGKGLTAMGGAIAEIGVVLGLLGGFVGFGSLFAGGAIYIVTQGLGDVADALVKLGSMSWDEAERGTIAMGYALGELGVAIGLLGGIAGAASLLGSGSIYIVTQGLGDLADAMAKFGSMDWDQIGKGIITMGAALSATAFGGIINTFSGIGASAVAKMAEPLGQLADSVKKWIDVQVPEGLATNMSQLALAIKEFTFGGLAAGAISQIGLPLGQLADSVKKWVDVHVPEGLSGDLGELADGVKSFTWAFAGAFSISSVVKPMNELADSITKWNDVKMPATMKDDLESFASAINNFADDVSDKTGLLKNSVKNIGSSIRDMMNVIDYNISEYKTTLSNTMTSVFTGIKNAIDSMTPKIVSSATSMAKQVNTKTTSAMGNQSDFYNAGWYGAVGFANGLRSGRNLVANAGWDLGRAAYNAAREAIDAHSPAKKFEELGVFSGLGYVNGLDNMRNKVSRSGTSMAQTALSSVQGVIQKVSSALQNEMDTQPRIRPVVDLTNARLGAQAISSMFNVDPTIGMANQISRTYSGNKLSSNEAILSAIKDLGAQRQGTGNTYQINGITYNEGSDVAQAIETIVRAAKLERRA